MEQLEYALSGVIAHLSELAHSSMSLAELAEFRAMEAFAAVEALVAGYLTKEARGRFEELSDESNLRSNSALVREYWLSGEADPDG
ncbi:MAG: hypothetical protein O2783_00510 [Chloroflexi bacterium]|nr:hypothetical protein [Chloroflexota bacterium]